MEIVIHGGNLEPQKYKIFEYRIIPLEPLLEPTTTTVSVADQDGGDHITVAIASYTAVVVTEPRLETISQTFETRVEDFSKASITVLDCLRCGNPLLAKEIKAKQHHCAPCKRLVEAAEHQERVSDAIHRANVRGGL